MNKILLSILLALSFKICLAEPLACVTLSQFKEEQEYFNTTKYILLWDACKEPFQLGNDNKINELQEKNQNVKFINPKE